MLREAIYSSETSVTTTTIRLQRRDNAKTPHSAFLYRDTKGHKTWKNVGDLATEHVVPARTGDLKMCAH